MDLSGFTAKWGPLPVWAWGLAGGGVVIFLLSRQKKPVGGTTTQAVGNLSSGGSTFGGGGGGGGGGTGGGGGGGGGGGTGNWAAWWTSWLGKASACEVSNLTDQNGRNACFKTAMAGMGPVPADTPAWAKKWQEGLSNYLNSGNTAGLDEAEAALRQRDAEKAGGTTTTQIPVDPPLAHSAGVTNLVPPVAMRGPGRGPGPTWLSHAYTGKGQLNRPTLPVPLSLHSTLHMTPNARLGADGGLAAHVGAPVRTFGHVAPISAQGSMPQRANPPMNPLPLRPRPPAVKP